MVDAVAHAEAIRGRAKRRRRAWPCSTRRQNSLSRSSRSLGRAAGDDGGVDRADRGADHPVGLDPGLVQRLIDADLIGAERAAALQHQHLLAVGAQFVA